MFSRTATGITSADQERSAARIHSDPGKAFPLLARIHRLASFLDVYGGFVGLLLLLVFFIVTLGTAAQKLLWYDELVTLGVASLGTWRDVYAFFYTGLDTTSATPALIAHVFLRLPISPELSIRLPGIVAFLGMLAFVYVFVRRRYPAVYALATCVALILPRTLTDQAIEARSYAYTLGCTALAMVCWQATERSSKTRTAALFGLWFGLAFAINVHSFGVFLFVPFAAAQAMRDYPTRKPDWPVWAALLLFPSGLAPVLHGQRIANHFYGSSFWSKPNRYLVLTSYQEVLFNADVIFLGIIFFFLVAMLLRDRWRGVQDRPLAQENTGFRRPEWTLVAVLGVMPFYVLPASYLIHVYRTTYVLPFAIGFFVATIALLAEAAARARVAGTVLLTLLLLCAAPGLASPFVGGVRALVHPQRVHEALEAEYNARPWVTLLRSSDLPLVGGDYYNYSQLWFYAPHEIKDRLTFVTDVPELEKYPAAETTQTNFLLFGDVLGYRTMDIRAYEREHSHFRVVIGPEDAIWLPAYLFAQEQRGQATFDLLGPSFDRVKGHASVFDVHVLAASAPFASQP